MQTWITDRDFYESASNLNNNHLKANIYENIHLLASLLDCVDDLILSDKCKTKIKNYKNYPQGKLWIGYEQDLINYIDRHLCRWHDYLYKINTYFAGDIIVKSINYKNYRKLCSISGMWALANQLVPIWITDELIMTHRSVLIQKEIEKQNKIYRSLSSRRYDESENDYLIRCKKYEDRISFHYREFWPDCSRDLKMRYDWRKD